MAQSSIKTIQKVDPVWARVRAEAEDIVQREPALAPFIFSSVLHHETLEASVVYRLTERLDHHDVPSELIRQAYASALDDDPKNHAMYVREGVPCIYIHSGYYL